MSPCSIRVGDGSRSGEDSRSSGAPGGGEAEPSPLGDLVGDRSGEEVLRDAIDWILSFELKSSKDFLLKSRDRTFERSRIRVSLFL